MGGTNGNGEKGPSPGSVLEAESTGRADVLEWEGGRGTIKEVVSLARMPFSEQRAAGGGRDVALGRGTEN